MNYFAASSGANGRQSPAVGEGPGRYRDLFADAGWVASSRILIMIWQTRSRTYHAYPKNAAAGYLLFLPVKKLAVFARLRRTFILRVFSHFDIARKAKGKTYIKISFLEPPVMAGSIDE